MGFSFFTKIYNNDEKQKNNKNCNLVLWSLIPCEVSKTATMKIH